ncbi:hypothetical protein ACFLTC_00540, partial [Chloroflexota bacterium]
HQNPFRRHTCLFLSSLQAIWGDCTATLQLSHCSTIPACPIQRERVVHYRTGVYYDTMTLCRHALWWS